ncbi:hypothetical protein BDV33DRAFT_206713 [Aspergillus novoparasiticus]|uniref:Isopenicillin N synthase-like Fe(2+) 2OG dioxygenase domain-containing protein n=1 Tax=Aspergillus novoparasiticus TaxID=986946 RepID=A0A5N6EKY5_9EURO|nr:hypothetical protein BDV33DRAFT_206713 [Aspergillus novoparasiticus]
MVESPTDDGLFYLDLRGWKDGQLINSLNACNGIVEEWFKKPKEEKAKTLTLFDAHGYKPVGQQSGVKEGQRGGYESLRPGLQVLSPTTSEWKWAHTREGHGIVNAGATLRFLSGERLWSTLHRVLPPTEDAVFVENDGKKTTADEWFLRKFHSFTQDRSVQRLDSVAVGGYGDFRSEDLTEQGQRNIS